MCVTYSLIIPAYNEAKRIRGTLESYLSQWDRRVTAIGKSYEIIVVANGCTDNTVDVVSLFRASRLSSGYLRIISLDKANKGLAVLEGFRAAQGEVAGFTDADGAIPPDVMLELMQLAESGKVAIGSKYLTGFECDHNQSLTRRLASRGWHLLVRLILGLRVTDTQAGAKAMPAEWAQAILDRVVPCNFAFDVSLLWEAKKAGYPIEEVPLRWEHLEGSKFHLFREVPRMFVALLKLRFTSRKPTFAQPSGTLKRVIREELDNSTETPVKTAVK